MQSETNLSTKDFKFKMHLTQPLEETIYVLKHKNAFNFEKLV